MRKRQIAILSSFLLVSQVGAWGCSSDETRGLCGDDEIRIGGDCLKDFPIALNGVGFLPLRSKKAVFQGDSPNFEVVNANTGETVMAGDAEGPSIAPDTEQEVYVADFSSVAKEGDYYIRAKGQRSGVFRIGEDALNDALEVTMLGLYGQRCGVAVDFNYNGERFRHGAGHLDEALMSRVGDGRSQDDIGGWHDAGDYGKYVRNGAFAVAFLLKAYEHYPELLDEREFRIPEQGGDTPDILDEARVELEWILKAQFKDGSFSHKITAEHFEPEVMPTQDRQERFFFSTSTTSTADAVAVLALAARLYDEFDYDFAEKCLDAAREGQDFLDAHPEPIVSVQLPNGEGTGTYAWDNGDDGDNDRLWAFSELWETTGDAHYLNEFEQRAESASMVPNFDWGDPGNIAIITYLDSAKKGRDEDLVDDKIRELIGTAEQITERALNDEFGRGLEWYYWGSNGVTLRMSYNLAAAHRIFPNTEYLDSITAQVDHIFGRNGFARSYVTGLGTNPLRYPHHRPSQSDATRSPWPGLLVGGPNTQGPLEDMPPGLAWEDDESNYYNNEIAINWNTALIYALIAADATADDESAECAPNCLPPVEGAGGAGGLGGGGN